VDRGILQSSPDLRMLDNSVLSINVGIDDDNVELLSSLPYVDVLWNEFFKDFYTSAKHRDVMSGGENNYFVDIFQKQLIAFRKEVLPTASYASKLTPDGINSSVLESVSNDWKAYLKDNDQFMLQARNVMFWVFKVLQQTLLVLEDSLINKSNAIKIPETAIAKGSKILREDPRGILEVPGEADGSHIPVAGLFIPLFDPPDRSEEFRVTHHNALAKVFRDDIRTFRGVQQKNFGLAAQRGGVVNTAIQDHAGILKAVARLSDGLVKAIISKLKNQ
jgi:hypothetical protein